MGEEVVAEVELDLARDADDDLAREVLEDAFGEGDGEQIESVLAKGRDGNVSVEVANGVARYHGEENPDNVIAENAECTDVEGRAIFPEIGEQRAQVLEHGVKLLR